MVVIELDVVLAAPDDFDWLAGFLREHGGLDGIIRLRLAPEASAEKSYVASYIFFFQAESFSDFFSHADGILCRRPDCHLVALHIRDGNRWLHRSMRQVRREVFRFEYFAAFCKCDVRIAGREDRFARLPRSFLQLLLIVG